MTQPVLRWRHLIKLRITHGYEPKVPFIGKIYTEYLQALDPGTDTFHTQLVRRVSRYLPPDSCSHWLFIDALRGYIDDGVAFRIERDWPDGRPVARLAGPAARVTFTCLAIEPRCQTTCRPDRTRNRGR